MVCPPLGGDNSRVLAIGLSRVQADKTGYNYFIPPSSVLTLLSMKYFVLKFAISGKEHDLKSWNKYIKTNCHIYRSIVKMHIFEALCYIMLLVCVNAT